MSDSIIDKYILISEETTELYRISDYKHDIVSAAIKYYGGKDYYAHSSVELKKVLEKMNKLNE